MAYLYKNLENNKKIIKSKLFPKIYKKNCTKKNVALIGIGGNIGDVKRRFNKLIFKLKKDSLVDILESSVIFKNPPFGYLEQNWFLNSVILVETNLDANKLLRYLQSIEKKFRRKREFKDGPRTLDLDIILFNKSKINKDPKLLVPHPSWCKRESVILPLSYLKGKRCLKRVL